MSLPPRSMSKPASRRTRIFSSSRALVSMNSSTSGWSTSRTTIFAARRVAPPDLIVPAEASAPRMKDTGCDESTISETGGTPYQVVSGHIEGVAGTGVQPEHVFDTVGLGGHDPGQARSVVDLGADRVVLH